MKAKRFSIILVGALIFALFFGHKYYASANEHPKPPHWLDTRLYFGLGPRATDATWQDFLDHEVTPRFPSGLSVLDVQGQWQGAPQSPIEHIRTKLLVIDYPDTPANDALIEAIRTAWKRRTGDQSVLKVTQPASVSF
jgi:hypothetical protein